MRTHIWAVIILLLATAANGAVLPSRVDTRPAAVQRMLQADPGAITAQDAQGRALLHLAVRNGDVETTKILLERGANPNAADNTGRTPLHWACFEGRPWARGDNASKCFELAQALISGGADVNAKDKLGSTPLHYSAWFGCKKTAALLIEKGAEVNAVNQEGYTPLHQAAFRGEWEVIDLLLENGAQVNRKSNSGSTPAARVCAGHASPAAKAKSLALLVERGAS